MQKSLPFELTKTSSFYEHLGNWIGDVFYDILPDSGFELRDEQIFMAFQLEKAYKDKKVIFAEAGVGTGKTIVYLLYSIAYARYTGKPAIIACADESLIEQLVKKDGDIKKLEKALGMEIDVRLAKSRDQYLCLQKLDQAMGMNASENIGEVFDALPSFVHDNSSMLNFYKYGDRKEYPHLTEREWTSISWDPLQDCLSCPKRHRCGQTLHRDYYRKAADIIVCSHDFYMEHIWTKDARKREGQLPLLPEPSSVVFDEGHLLEFACQKALTYRFTEETLEMLLMKLQENDVREKTLYIIEHVLMLNNCYFDLLNKEAIPVEGSNRHELSKSDQMIASAQELLNELQKLSEELVFESELFTINEYELRIVEEYLDQIMYSLTLLINDKKGIIWFEYNHLGRTLVIMPRLVEEILSNHVFSEKIPYIFSSATLSNNGDFNYLSKSLGIKDYLSFTVNSPFQYEEKMSISLFVEEKGERKKKWDQILETITETNGRSLLLFNNRLDLDQFKTYLKDIQYNDFPILFEGDGEISTIVQEFQEREETVLCAFTLWEGLDIPGSSLQNVMIASLPFPPYDPVFNAKRNSASDAFSEVDLPYMLLRLRQGVGRLIRTSTDVGLIHIWMNVAEKNEILDEVKRVLPVPIKVLA
ncbi:ATP-dependent DNA helicase [Lederbergia citrea]|uniref:ATP-dependent DNA helicase n=1 Tax=Lederbergia citrea TaxID=2833581 RepID=A0A942UNV3_9BACI|nr:ATP-dependent DNA helicase [Lederbergia citrea]MBS4176609.1 ATP-dependent DNA helicase [Lederbergia citrea]MBS4203170.1 ATP-dependent DNA helicase [Lederbergia citrea]MBS4222158.1 ATP-dependent DNA helicase [Lederbergia citrea]